MPRLYVVAGPNGVGKSTFGPAITGISDLFNGDACLKLLRESTPTISESALRFKVDEEIFSEIKLEVVKEGKDFAFETNFTSDQPTKSVREFRNAGYLTFLIFISVPFIEDCHQRVKMRVLQGGHPVDAETIERNFYSGYDSLHKYFMEFDNVSLWTNPISNRSSRIPQELLNWSKNGLKLEILSRRLPQWAIAFVEIAEKYRALHDAP